MRTIRSISWLGVALFLLWPLGCTQSPVNSIPAEGVPLIRVKVLENQDRVTLVASEAPLARILTQSNVHRLNFPPNKGVMLTLSAAGSWQVGTADLGAGELLVTPARDGALTVNGVGYRGRYRFVPVGSGKFDVINDVDVDNYLKSVVSKELLSGWNIETYKAQTIVARTYAIYEAKTSPEGRAFDVYDDERSQMYGGIDAESAKSIQAVTETAGIVVAYGEEGQEKIFKAYFSSCCGGVTQSASDAFNEPYIAPLSDQNNGTLCNASPRFNWGPVVVNKEELTRRFRLWGTRRQRPEKDMATVSRIEVQASNRSGRPTRFVISDVKGQRYSLGGEEIRWAVNTDAAEGTTLYSSFFKIINDSDVIRFVDGHGHGHGVGLCQWCAQARAEAGMRHEDIVLAAFQKAKLKRAY